MPASGPTKLLLGCALVAFALSVPRRGTAEEVPCNPRETSLDVKHVKLSPGRLASGTTTICGVELTDVPVKSILKTCKATSAQRPAKLRIESPRGYTLVSGACSGTQAEGLWTMHGRDGRPFWRRTYRKAALHGPADTYAAGTEEFVPGDLRESGTYDRGQRVGAWKLCYGKGKCHVVNYGAAPRSIEPTF